MLRGRDNQKGQAMVEFVIVAPLLVLLVFGIIQFGILLNNYVTLTDAVARERVRPRSAGRFRSRRRDDSAIQQAAVNLRQSRHRVTVDPYDTLTGTHNGRRVATSP